MVQQAWAPHPDQDGTASAGGHSCTATNPGPHRAQRNMSLHVGTDPLWYAYKAYIMIISTFQTSIYMYNY